MKAPHTVHITNNELVDVVPETPNWKPWLFNPLFIFSLSIFHILNIVGIQVLINNNSHDQPHFQLVRQNGTDTDFSKSIFILDENDSGSFILWTYLPVTLAVIVASFWEALDLMIRKLEPFRQLSSPQGGTVDNALCLNYTSIFGLLTPFKAIKRGHWAVFITSTAFILVSIVLTAVSGSIFSIDWGSLSFSAGRLQGPRLAIVTINKDVALATQAIHSILLAASLAINPILFFRKTGLYRDPSGIGALASFISDADKSGCTTLQLFHQIPSFAHSDTIRTALQNVTFRLSHVYSINPDGSTSTAYQLTADTPPGYTLPITRDQLFYRPVRTDASGMWLTKRMALLAEILIWLGAAIVISVIFYATRVISRDISRTTISKIVYTLFITLGGMIWLSIQRDLQSFEPWRQLRTGRSVALYKSVGRSDVSTMGLAISAAVCLIRGSLIMFWATFCVFLIQCLTIFAPPLIEIVEVNREVASKPGIQAIGVLTGSKGAAMVAAGLALQIAIFVNLVFLLFTRTSPFMPRAPATIASHIVYLCRSDKLLGDFSSTSMLSRSQLEERLGGYDRRCLVGWFWWRRGQAWFVGVEEYDEGEPWARYDFRRGVDGHQPCT